MDIKILTPNDQTIRMNVNPSLTVEDLKKMMEVETGVPVQLQQMLFHGNEMRRNSKKLRKYGVCDGDLVFMERSDSLSPSRIADCDLGFNLDGSAKNPAAFRQHILNDDDMMRGIYHNDPELAEILCGDDLYWLQLFLRTRNSQKAELQRELALLCAHKSDPEVGERIADVIDAWNADSLERIPEYIQTEKLPHIVVQVNGITLEALVDTGAQMSVMNKNDAEYCRLSKLIDLSYTKDILGVGGLENAVGRINIAPIKIGNMFCLGSFVLLEYSPCIFGMDILRKNQCVIDTKANILKIRGGEDVPLIMPEYE